VTLAALIRKRGTGTCANDNPAKAANNEQASGEPLAGLAALALANPTEPEVESLLDSAAEGRRQRALKMLADNPVLRLAVVCDGSGDPVPVTVAIRDKGTCEVLIPAARFDPFALLELVERHGASAH
jgi:hypothetical protein